MAGSSNRRPSISIKKKEESIDQQRYLRTPRPKIIPDDVDDDVVERSASVSDSERGQRNRHQHREKSRLRQRSRINYREEEDDDGEEDELMLGAEVWIMVFVLFLLANKRARTTMTKFMAHIQLRYRIVEPRSRLHLDHHPRRESSLLDDYSFHLSFFFLILL